MFESPGIPKGLAEISPGAFLGGILESIDRDSLSGQERVELMRAERRQAAHYQAGSYASMVAVARSTAEALPADLPQEMVEDSTAGEIQAALTLTRRSALTQLDFATTLITDYPDLWRRLSDGSLDVPRVMVIVNQTSHLETKVRELVTTEILTTAPRLTTGQIRARLARLIISVDPDSARLRYREGLEARRVVVDANPDGTANLCGWSLPAAHTQAVMRRVNRLARSLKTKEETRSIDQLRADVFLDLLRGHAHPNRADRGVVDLKVDLTTLAGLNDNPGQIPGWGPVLADIARQVVQEQTDSEWRITITDPDGQPVIVTTTSRRPTKFQRRLVEARNPTCIFPGDRTPAADCDLDHTHAWSHGGPTSSNNLGPCCRHHHRLKDAGWKLEMITPGHYQWTSPLGHTYSVGPDPP